MSIYAIGDLHLSLDKEKPMDIFGTNWKDHEKIIKENWIKTVNNNDLVILLGDFSWAMNIQEMYQDFKYINELPGKKILLKGNHDYWWTTVTSMRKYLEENKFENIDFLYNNSYEYDNKLIVGTRGWALNDTKNAEKMNNREEERLKISINSVIDKNEIDSIKQKELICVMHYPPINKDLIKKAKYIDIMKENKVKLCLYGHLHGKSHEEAFEGIFEGIEFKLVSSDYLNFELYKIVN